MKLATIIMFLIPAVATHNHRTFLESILKLKANLYAKVNIDVQNVVNNLFELLNLTSSFLAKSRIKSFLTMHYNLNSMSERNYDAYDQIIDAARPDTGNQSTKRISLYELIEEALDAEPFNLFVKLKENKHSRDHTKYKETIEHRAATITTETFLNNILSREHIKHDKLAHATNMSAKTSLEHISEYDPVFSNSKEFMTFVMDFVKKVNDLNESDFTKTTLMTTPSIPLIEEETKKPDLEDWQPPFDHFNVSSTRRIFMGNWTKIRRFPFVVSIHVMGVFVCSGSILSSDVIITAASCLQLLHNNRFYRENPKVVHVRVGSDWQWRGGDWIPVLECYFYPNYNPRVLANNLVLLRLHRHIKFSVKLKKIRKIRYDKSPTGLPMNIDGVMVVGWGSKKYSNKIDDHDSLMAVKLDVYPMRDCANMYNNRQKQFVTKKHFCAGFMSMGAGACNKDLGSPGVVDGILVGVVSFGSPICGTIDHPTVFTKIGFYAKWIEHVLELESWSLHARTTIKPANTPIHYYIDLATRTTQPHLIKPLINPEYLRNRESWKDRLFIAKNQFGMKN